VLRGEVALLLIHEASAESFLVNPAADAVNAPLTQNLEQPLVGPAPIAAIVPASMPRSSHWFARSSRARSGLEAMRTPPCAACHAQWPPGFLLRSASVLDSLLEP
jgi:hypothetical protein